MILEIFISTAVIILAVVLGGFGARLYLAQKVKEFTSDLAKRDQEKKDKMFEVDILNKLGEKIDYSLGAQNIIEAISGSLPGMVDYSAVAYMLVLPEKIVFNIHIEKMVSQDFIDSVRSKMMDSLSLLLSANLQSIKIEETVSGPVSKEMETPLKGFFNIPLEISGRAAGLLTIADIKKNFCPQEKMDVLYRVSQQAGQAVSRLQKVVQSENSKMNSLVASMTEGVIMTDKDYNITVVNPAARKAAGLEIKKGLSLADFTLGLGNKIDFRDKMEDSVKLDKVFISENISLPSGCFQIAVAPVKDSLKTLGAVAVFRDLTKEKEVEQLKEDFTSMIVHELRSPLDSIKKIIEMMRSSQVKKAKQTEFFQMIYGSSSDMLELINNLLDIAKIEAGKFQLSKKPSDIKEIVQGRILFFGISAEDAGVKLESHFGKNLPAKVELDSHTISQVLNNLISNALKFTKEKGLVQVQALYHEEGENLEKEAKEAGINWFVKGDIGKIKNSLVVAVTDNGVGIPADQTSKLFNKFVQAKTMFVKKGGTGLGLAITKSIIDSHGGVVGVASVEGKGSTFYFTLPV